MSENGDEHQDFPNAPEPKYPPEPVIKSVEISGSGFGQPRKIDATVKYYTHRSHFDPFETDVHFRVLNGGTAELRDVDGDGKLIDQMSAILVASDRVQEHSAVDSVNGLEQIASQAGEFVEKCEGDDSE